MTRLIKEGDLVYVYLDHHSDLRQHFVNPDGTPVRFQVHHTSSDVGDPWYLEGDNGITVALNPNSANLDGIVLVQKG